MMDGSAAAVLTLMIAWLAYGNATSVRALPQSAVKRPASPQVDDGMLSQSVPSTTIPAQQAAAIVDEAPPSDPSGRPAMVMVPAEELAGTRVPQRAAILPEEERVSPPPPAVKQAVAPRHVAKANKPVKRAELRSVAAKKPKAPLPAQAAGNEIDSDVALLSAILAHSTRHAAERAQQESCQGKKCAAKPAIQP